MFCLLTLTNLLKRLISDQEFWALVLKLKKKKKQPEDGENKQIIKQENREKTDYLLKRHGAND